VFPFRYIKAADEQSALRAAAAGARYIAGGTTLVDLMRETVERSDALVDINALPYTRRSTRSRGKSTSDPWCGCPNERGHLWSIDLPHPLEKDLHAQIGAAVPSSHRSRWSFVEGSSRRRLPSLLRSLAQVDLFIHDSLHTARNTRFEMEQTLRVLASAGIMIVDDISPHQAFAHFARDFPRLQTLVCPHSDRAGSFFGLVHKPT
jgi:hypothetical protein